MRVGNCVADGNESAEKPSEGFLIRWGLMIGDNRVAKTLPPDQPHCIAGVAAIIAPQSIKRYDSRVVQAGGGLRLKLQPALIGRFSRDLFLNEFDRDIAAEHAVGGLQDHSQTA